MVIILRINYIFLKYQVTNRQAERTKTLTNLLHIVEEFNYSGIVLSDTKLLEELDQTCRWANNEGGKSSLPEINKRIDDIELKVRDRLHLLCISIHIIILFLYFGRNHQSGRTYYIRSKLSLLKMHPFSIRMAIG